MMSDIQDKRDGKVITFYSYKGGVGRSMTMANIAVLLAEWGYKTLIIDWDLEAPGLENFYKDYILDIHAISEKEGLINLLNLNAQKESVDVSKIDWKRFISTIQIKETKLDFLSAGKRDDEYISNVRQFDYGSFYSDYGGGQFIEDLRDAWKASYDFILIDSRTGLTDSSGVCTIQMPDILILLFTPNVQSFNGIKSVSQRAIEGQKKVIYDRFHLRTFPIPSRIENAETTLQDQWIKKIAKESAQMFEWLPHKSEDINQFLISPLEVINQVKIPYRTLYAYDEKLAVVDRGRNDPQDLGYVYETIAACIANDLESFHLLVDSRDLFIKKAKGIEIIDPLEAEKLRQEKERVEAESKERVTQLEATIFNTQLASKRIKRKVSVFAILMIILVGFAIGYFGVQSYDQSKQKKKELEKFTLFSSKADSAFVQAANPTDTILSLYTDYYALTGQYKDSAASYKIKLDSAMLQIVKSRLFNLYYSLDPSEKINGSVDWSFFLSDTVKQYGNEVNIAAKNIFKKWDSLHLHTVLLVPKTGENRFRYIDVVTFNAAPSGFTLLVREHVFGLLQKNPTKLEIQMDRQLRINSVKTIADITQSSSSLNADLVEANSNILESQVKNFKAADSKVKPNLEKIAQVLNEETTGVDSFWVYLGERNKTEWIDKNFNFEKLPQANDIITTTTSVYKRTEVPIYVKNNWQFGKIIGVVAEGKTVKVVKVTAVAGGFFWAMVTQTGKEMNRLKK